ncbi:hypothetical protein STCU_10324 [Strigomonas culicis]|uniref:Uncharacterized protein n=1 Tax=Strigomonas culicis TaxID=28005 RepID=S9UTM5_9TRYP|nr:hypothetical protein STCU_10324 [Strigomonas culicis]|eukprot:EPY17906.1 hypothetical protein STCU_10324 [Strigomonas culicis]
MDDDDYDHYTDLSGLSVSGLHAPHWRGEPSQATTGLTATRPHAPSFTSTSTTTAAVGSRGVYPQPARAAAGPSLRHQFQQTAPPPPQQRHKPRGRGGAAATSAGAQPPRPRRLHTVGRAAPRPVHARRRSRGYDGGSGRGGRHAAPRPDLLCVTVQPQNAGL